MRPYACLSLLLSLACSLLACSTVPPPPAERARELPAAPSDPPPDVSEERTKASQALESGDLELALDTIQRAVGRSPRDARSHALRGLIQQARARRRQPPDLWLLESAETDLLCATQLDPKDAEVRHALGLYYLADGHQEAALKVFDEVLAIDGFHRKTLETCSRVRYERGEERAALELLINLHRVWPQAEAMTWYRRAQCHLRIALSTDAQTPRQREDALRQSLRAFREYRQQHPEDSDGIMGEAFVRARLFVDQVPEPPGELDAIVALYAEAQQLRPKVAEPSFQAGAFLEEKGQPARAQEFYGRALAADPDHVPSLINLARLLAPHLDTRDAARDFYMRALPRLEEGPEKKAIEAWLVAAQPESRKEVR